MKNILTLVLFIFLVTSCNSENKLDITNVDVNLSNKIKRVEPPNWWIDMKTKDLQLLVYGKNISNYVPVINSSNVKLISTERVKNENYLFINISIDDNAKPENIEINLKQLLPWRKGPFIHNDLHLEREGVGALKWQSIKHNIKPLKNTRCLDVGDGNGHLIIRMALGGERYGVCV